MKNLVRAGIFVFAFASLAFANSIEVGMTEAELIKLKGSPQTKATTGKKSIYGWPDADIILVDGKVEQVQLRDRTTEKQNAAEPASANAKNQAAAESTARKKDAIRKNYPLKTIREVETDMRAFVDKPFYLEGTLAVSSYYDDGYDYAQGTHLSFEIRSGGQRCHAYMERAKAAGLRQQLLDGGGSLKGVFGVVLRKSRWGRTSSLNVELLEYRSSPE